MLERMLRKVVSPRLISNRGLLQKSMTNLRPFSSKREKMLEKQKRINQRIERLTNKNQDLPEFPQLLRVLYKQAHPDLIRSTHPEYATINDQSLQTLNGILSSVKTTSEFPPQLKTRIPFYIRQITPANTAEYSVVTLSVATPGGDCRHSLQRSFEAFFKAAGIHDGAFKWGKDYFPAEFDDGSAATSAWRPQDEYHE